MRVALAAALVLAAAPTPPPAPAANIVRGPAPQAVGDLFVAAPGDLTADDWVTGLEAPWSLVFLPDGRALVSERPGRIRVIEGGRLARDPVVHMEVARGGEAGLMGLALDPEFPRLPYLYAMYTQESGGGRINRVGRFRLEGGHATFERVIVDGIPGASNHNGGRIAFGPDGLLYIGTGETFRRELAQMPDNLGGKILRVTRDGTPAPANPRADSPIYTLGHRNVQGLAWHPETGEMFAGEHGPSGEDGLRAYDELNVIRPGANYGWPLVVGAARRPSFVDPLIAWVDRTTPLSGMTFWHGALYIATLRSQALVRAHLVRDGGGWRATTIERLFHDGNRSRYGRLRDAVVGPDGALYVLTSNRDGRGSPHEGDDRILRVSATK